MKIKYSEVDKKGKLFVDCSECNRGGNGNDKDKCSCGHKITKGHKGGCFMGTLIEGLSVHAKCSKCGNEVMQDSQGNWF